MKINLIRAKFACTIAKASTTNQELVLSAILDIEEQRKPNTPAVLNEIITKEMGITESYFRKIMSELYDMDLLIKKDGLVSVNRKYIKL